MTVKLKIVPDVMENCELDFELLQRCGLHGAAFCAELITEDWMSLQVSEDVETSTEVMEAVKHPLEDSWTIWLGTSNKNKWGQNVKLTSFDTVEDFWCLYHHMKLPSELEKGQDYSIFKKGINPTWEDEANKHGGRWIINFDKRVNELNSNWIIVILILIGATLEYQDAVCGAVVNVRTPKTKIGIWLKDASNQEAILSVGKHIKRHLGYRGGINFHKHNVNVNMFFI